MTVPKNRFPPIDEHDDFHEAGQNAHELLEGIEVPLYLDHPNCQTKNKDMNKWSGTDGDTVTDYEALTSMAHGSGRFGFKAMRGGVHLARTMMLEELQRLFAEVSDPDADRTTYIQAIEIDNCLAKPSGKTRTLTARHLTDLYGLDPGIAIFRALRFFWQRDPDGGPLLALLCAFARDSILRSSAAFIQGYSVGEIVTREALEEFIDNLEPGRFSKATLKSTAQNINSTWTQAGHLKGRSPKIRSSPQVTSGSVAYALFLGYLHGIRGQALLESEYCRLLDHPPGRLIELAAGASQKGWIVFKHIGSIIEALFPNLLTEEERQWLRV